MNSFESFYIKLFNSNGDDGYNLDSGGLNKKHSDDTKRKIGKIHKGKKLSDEHKNKLLQSNKGRTHTDESKYKISESNKGRTFSDEHKLKLSESHKGKTPHNKGMSPTDESRSRMSESHKGKAQSDETKSKKSESMKGKNSKKVKSILDNITFNSCEECATYYKINKGHFKRYYNGKIHKKSGQTFILL